MQKHLIISISVSTVFYMATAGYLFYSEPTYSALPEAAEGDAGGRVLGAAEEAGQTEALANPLPQSRNIADIAPKKTAQAGAEPEVLAGSALVMDSRTGKILYSRNANQPAAIASITKLMTALVFLDYNPGWERQHEISADEKVGEGKEYVYPGDIVTAKNLFYLSLVGSANTATQVLAGMTGLSAEEFVAAMNAKARELNLENTSFKDCIGLDSGNRSTAFEIAKLAKTALASEEISAATMTGLYSFSTAGGRLVEVYSTDSLLESFPAGDITLHGGKTGFTEAAGYCFAGKFRKSGGHEIFSVVLGGNSPSYRFEKTMELVDWVYRNYAWE